MDNAIKEMLMIRAVENREFAVKLYNSLSENFTDDSMIIQLAELSMNQAAQIEKELRKKFNY